MQSCRTLAVLRIWFLLLIPAFLAACGTFDIHIEIPGEDSKADTATVEIVVTAGLTPPPPPETTPTPTPVDRLPWTAEPVFTPVTASEYPVPEVSADWDLLFLATFNLLDNALKFFQPDDTVEVRAFDDRAFVVVEVADTGPGIPEEELPRVWEELYRGQGARGVPGSGLGLALTRTILERHGGQVQVRSRAGQGTVVTMRLPVA